MDFSFWGYWLWFKFKHAKTRYSFWSKKKKKNKILILWNILVVSLRILIQQKHLCYKFEISLSRIIRSKHAYNKVVILFETFCRCSFIGKQDKQSSYFRLAHLISYFATTCMSVNLWLDYTTYTWVNH